MSINTLSVGRDYVINIQGPNGTVTLDNITSFSSQATPNTHKSTAANGNINFATIPGGFSGTIEIERQTPALENFWATYEDTYYDGENILPYTMITTITETNGAQSQYIYIGVAFEADGIGTVTGDKLIPQRIMFKASRMEQVV
jgi:hypothetical protein